MSHARKVFYLITGLEVGGAEHMLLETIRLLNRDRFQPVVACLRGRGAVGTRIEELDVRVHYLEFTGGFDLAGYRNLYSLLRRERPDILNTYMIHANLVGRVVGRLAGVRVVISNVEVKLMEKRYLLLFDALSSFLVDKYICVSRSVANHTMRTVRVPQYKVELIWNGINTRPFAQRADLQAIRHSLGLGEGPVIGVICKLRRQKGLAYLLQAAPEIKRRVPDATFIIAGDGPEEYALRAQAARSGLDGYCRFLGYRSDVAALLSIIDVYVLPSLYEGLAVGLLEAMYARKAIVCTDIPENAAVIEDGRTGILVPPRDPGRLADGVLRMIGERARAAAMAEGAHRLAAERFTMESNVRRKMDLYERLLASGSNAARA